MLEVAWLFLGFSITNIVVYQHVFSWMREFITGISDKRFFELAVTGDLDRFGFRIRSMGRLVHCHACFGFWCGLSLCLLGGHPIVESMTSCFPVGCFYAGAIQSGFNLVMWLILRKLGAEEL